MEYKKLDRNKIIIKTDNFAKICYNTTYEQDYHCELEDEP